VKAGLAFHGFGRTGTLSFFRATPVGGQTLRFGGRIDESQVAKLAARLASLVDQAFRQYLRAFDAYRAEVGDVELAHIVFDDSRHVDFRQGIHRIHPVSYYDEQLCLRSFGLGLGDMLTRLAGACESVSRFGMAFSSFFRERLCPCRRQDLKTRDLRRRLTTP
jgi:hypothetical protein